MFVFLKASKWVTYSVLIKVSINRLITLPEDFWRVDHRVVHLCILTMPLICEIPWAAQIKAFSWYMYQEPILFPGTTSSQKKSIALVSHHLNVISEDSTVSCHFVKVCMTEMWPVRDRSWSRQSHVQAKAPPLGEDKYLFHKRGRKSSALLPPSYCAILGRIYSPERLDNG